MGEVLAVLERNLRSQQEQLTPQEANVLQTCKSKAVRDFTSACVAGAAVAWAGTWKLSNPARLFFAGGAATLLGLWRFGTALDSCVDHILALDGTRMQRELAHIIVRKYQYHPSIIKYMHRNFYSEQVFDDSSSDKPTLRWRYRNFFSDNAAYGQNTHDSDSQSNSDSCIDPDSRKAGVASKQVPMNPATDMMEDPLEGIFGHAAPVEEISHSNTSSSPARVPTSSRKRSNRRRRTRLHEAA